MEDLIRLIISNQRLENSKNNNFKLTQKEFHYLIKVMRSKIGDKVFILNGEGSLWKGIIKDNSYVEIENYKTPFLIKEKKKPTLGLAISTPKYGFEDILRMSTEIGIDIIQPITSERQIKKNYDNYHKKSRWESIINEAVEQCERLWKPKLLDSEKLYDWLKKVKGKDFVSVSITRDEKQITLKEWLNNTNIPLPNEKILWNVIGPEGGWSNKELILFNSNKIHPVRLSENILRTSTAAINTASVLAEMRDELIGSINYS